MPARKRFAIHASHELSRIQACQESSRNTDLLGIEPRTAVLETAVLPTILQVPSAGLETAVLPIILQALTLGRKTIIEITETIGSNAPFIGRLFQLGFGVYCVLLAFLAVFVAPEFLLERLTLVHRVVLIFADLAA